MYTIERVDGFAPTITPADGVTDAMFLAIAVTEEWEHEGHHVTLEHAMEPDAQPFAWCHRCSVTVAYRG